MKKILIITGDNLGLFNRQINYEDIVVLKFPVVIDGKEYRETEEYTAKYLINRFRQEHVSAQTQALVKGDMIEAIEANKDKYDAIIHITMGSSMSAATFQTAEAVRKEYEAVIPILNIDSKQVSSGVGNCLMRLVEVLRETDDLNEIKQRMEKIIDNTYLYICLPDLNFLYRGGRIGRARSLLGSVLKIIPVVGLFGDDAEASILPAGKGRTYMAANKVIIDNVKNKMKTVNSIKLINILHLEDNNSPSLQDLEAQIKNELKYDKLLKGHPRLAEAVHTGPGGWIACFSLI